MLSPELKSKINALWDKLWSRGVTEPTSSISQISYLLFMKRLDEMDFRKINEKTSEEYVSIFVNNENARWSNFSKLVLDNYKDLDDLEKKKKEKELLSIIKDIAFPFIKNLGKNIKDFKGIDEEELAYTKHMQNATFDIDNAKLLSEVIIDIEEIQTIITDQENKGQKHQDTLGDVYEYLLSQLSQAGKNGQFRTPRHIIQLMCEILNPTIKDKICDPSSGTSGFLVGAYQHILTKNTSKEYIEIDEETNLLRGIKGDNLKKKDWLKLKEETFYGYDISQGMIRIGLMNLMMHDISKPHVEYVDTLSNDYEERFKSKKFSKILANPPFKGRLNKDEISDELKSRVQSTQTELLFIIRIILMLELKGTAAVIVPEGVLFNSGNAYKTIRERLLKDCSLDAIISMPSGVFYPYTGVKTAILVFTKIKQDSTVFNTKKVWFYEMNSDGYSLDSNRKPLKEKPLPLIVKDWENKKENENDLKSPHFHVDIKRIIENDFDLSLNRYKEFVYNEKKYDSPKNILKALIELEMEISSGLNELNEII